MNRSRTLPWALAAALALFAGCRSAEPAEDRPEAGKEGAPPPPAAKLPYETAHLHPQNAIAEFWLRADDPEPAAIIPLAHGGRADIRGPLNLGLARIRLFAPKEVTLLVFRWKGSFENPPDAPSGSFAGTANAFGLVVSPEDLQRLGLDAGIHSIEWRLHGVLPSEAKTLRVYPAPPPRPEETPKKPVPPWRVEPPFGESPPDGGKPPATP